MSTGAPGTMEDIDSTDIDPAMYGIGVGESAPVSGSEARSAAAEFNNAMLPDTPEIREPSPGDVMLSWGYTSDGVQHRHAVVRELNGADEEAISKIKTSTDDRYYVMLEDMLVRRATERIGDFTLSDHKDLLSSLLIGDRGLLFAHILLATYGPTKDYDEVRCPHCEALSDIQVDWFDLLDIKALKGEAPITEVEIGKANKKQLIALRFPTGRDHVDVFGSDKEMTEAEVNTAMLCRIITNDNIPNVRDFVLKLSIPDRRKLIKAVAASAPSVGFKECEVPCPHCDQPIRWTFSWADLLLG